MKHIIYKILVFSLMCLFLSQCSCDEEPKPDPCAIVMQPTAMFKSSSVYYPKNKHGNEFAKNGQDTFIRFNYLYFTPQDTSAAGYAWKFGTDPRIRTQRSQILGVGEKDTNTNILITLTTKANADKIKCHPTADSIQSYSKIVHILPDRLSFVGGKWRGAYTYKPDSVFDIDIHVTWNPNSQSYNIINIPQPFPKGCDSLYAYFIPDVGLKSNYTGNYGYTLSAYWYILELKEFKTWTKEGKLKVIDVFGYGGENGNDEITFQVHRNIDSLTVYIPRSNYKQYLVFKAKRTIPWKK